MPSNLKRHMLALTVMTPLAIWGHPAPASPDVEVSRLVAYADLDLGHPRGRAVLDRRIEQAVDEVCGHTGRALFEQKVARRCRVAARADVSPQIARVLDEARRPNAAGMSLAAVR